MSDRRSFLIGLSATLAAPAIVRADSLMKLWVPRMTIGPRTVRWSSGWYDTAIEWDEISVYSSSGFDVEMGMPWLMKHVVSGNSPLKDWRTSELRRQLLLRDTPIIPQVDP